MKLVFATRNANKVKEVQSMVGTRLSLISLDECGIKEEIPETSPTIEGNALQKARYVYEKTGLNCMADDTGLLVDALNGEPGVYSARYAGEGASHSDNIRKLLERLGGAKNRSAHFKTVIALIVNGEEVLFDGIARGEILNEMRGEKGFGYDPIFQPIGFDRTFAEMSLDEKNEISHRGLAMKKASAYLKNL